MTYTFLTSRILLQMKPSKEAQKNNKLKSGLLGLRMAWEAQNSFSTFWGCLRHNLVTTVLNGL